MAYKERKLTKDEAYAFYHGLNAGFTNKKKSTGGAKKKSTAGTSNTKKSKKK